MRFLQGSAKREGFRIRAMKIFDIHVHIFPEKIAVKAAKSIGDFYDGIPMHGNGTVELAVEMLEAAGVKAFAAHSVAMTPHNVERINDFILASREKMPDRLSPLAAIHPRVDDMQATMDAIVSQGFRGIKIHPDMQRFAVDDPAVAPMMDAISQSGLPLLIHSGDYRYDYDGPQRLLNLHKNFPELKMICAHFGGWGEWDRAVEMLPGNGMMIDCSSSLYQWPAERAVEAIRRFGAENVFFGSDYPMWNPKEEVERFMGLDLTDAEREAILWGNAARMFGL